MADPALETVVAQILAAPLPAGTKTRIVGIDGFGGAGKSTLAARLAPALPGARILHTDDFAAWDDPLDWWPRLLDEVLRPLGGNRPARYRARDWETGRFGDWVDLAPGGVVLLEGVSALRREFRPYLAFGIFVDTPRALRLARGLARDGEQARGLWQGWMAAEDSHEKAHQSRRAADLVLTGALPYV